MRKLTIPSATAFTIIAFLIGVFCIYVYGMYIAEPLDDESPAAQYDPKIIELNRQGLREPVSDPIIIPPTNDTEL
jgi:hypothetical protein